MLSITKEEKSCYVFLVSSEEFFFFWIMKSINYVTLITIGNLSFSKAEAFCNEYLARIKKNKSFKFSDLYNVCGKFSYILFFFLINRWEHVSH